jgi:D-alanyl-D-alanine carboxypeptidase
LTSGVIQTQPIAAIPGSSEPMKPVKVKTVQVKAGQMKLASAGSVQPAGAITNAIPPVRPEVPETSSAVVAIAETNKAETNRAETNRAETNRVEIARAEMPPQPANHGTGNGVLGVLPASNLPPSSTPQAMAYADPAPRAQPPQPQPQIIQQNGAIKPAVTHTGWIVQVGALESESEARQRIEAARNQARGLLAKADPFTEPVVAKGDRKLFRARFAGLDRDQAEAVCRTLKRSDISCIAVRN